MKQSTTGINLLSSKYSFAISFNDTRCPYCGAIMHVETQPMGGKRIETRYVCKRCGLFFPIDKRPQLKYSIPVSDNRIKEFMNDFGKDIRERRLQLKVIF